MLFYVKNSKCLRMGRLKETFEVVRDLTQFVYGGGLKRSSLDAGTMAQIDAHIENLGLIESKQIIRGLMVYIKQLKRALAGNLYDPLTGAYNRQSFMSELTTNLLSGNIPADDSVHLVMMDLDGFKQLNDNCGHSAGDEALKEFCERISAYFGEDIIIGRLGGDEFAVIIHGDFDESELRLEIREAIKGIYKNPDPDISSESNEIFPLGVSLGTVSLAKAEGMHTQNYKFVIHELIKEADRGVYADKRNKLQRLESLRNQIAEETGAVSSGMQVRLPMHE